MRNPAIIYSTSSLPLLEANVGSTHDQPTLFYRNAHAYPDYGGRRRSVSGERPRSEAESRAALHENAGQAATAGRGRAERSAGEKSQGHGRGRQRAGAESAGRAARH